MVHNKHVCIRFGISNVQRAVPKNSKDLLKCNEQSKLYNIQLMEDSINEGRPIQVCWTN